MCIEHDGGGDERQAETTSLERKRFGMFRVRPGGNHGDLLGGPHEYVELAILVRTRVNRADLPSEFPCCGLQERTNRVHECIRIDRRNSDTTRARVDAHSRRLCERGIRDGARDERSDVDRSDLCSIRVDPVCEVRTLMRQLAHTSQRLLSLLECTPPISGIGQALLDQHA